MTYQHDPQGRITAILRDSTNTFVASVDRYHPSGAIARLKYGNNFVEDFAYDGDRRWLESISGGPVTLTYDYTPGGNVRKVTDSSAEVGAVRQQTFGYDNVDRLRVITGNWGANEYRDEL